MKIYHCTAFPLLIEIVSQWRLSLGTAPDRQSRFIFLFGSFRPINCVCLSCSCCQNKSQQQFHIAVQASVYGNESYCCGGIGISLERGMRGHNKPLPIKSHFIVVETIHIGPIGCRTRSVCTSHTHIPCTHLSKSNEELPHCNVICFHSKCDRAHSVVYFGLTCSTSRWALLHILFLLWNEQRSCTGFGLLAMCNGVPCDFPNDKMKMVAQQSFYP